jgi:hypothetical protein
MLKSGIQKEMEKMLRENSSVEDRQRALKKLKFQWHPDKNLADMEVAKSVFQFVGECEGWFLDAASPHRKASLGGKAAGR